MDDRRLQRVRRRAGSGERDPDRQRRDDAQPAELAAVLRILQPQEREGGVAEYLSLITGYRWLTAIVAVCYIGALIARQYEDGRLTPAATSRGTAG